MTWADRYASIGLERNPFSTQALGANRVFIDRGIPAPPPPGSCTLVQLIGDRGYGKSTHLTRWRATQPGPYHYIPLRPYRHRWACPPTQPALTVYGDEIDRMPAALRQLWFHSLARAHATVVIGTHADLASTALRVGFTVVSHHLRPFSRNELGAYLNQRLAAAAVAGTVPRAFTETEIDAVLSASGGTPRDAEDAAHRVLAERVGKM